MDVTGNDQFTDEQLLEGVDVKIGQEVNLGNLRQMASQIKKYYRDQGFIAAYAYVPPQSIDGGHVEIAVVEGVLDSIEIKNNRWFSEKVFRQPFFLH